MDASDLIRKKQARYLASVHKNGENVGQNTPLTPGDLTTVRSQYPKSQFAFANNIYPCGPILCSTIYTNQNYYSSQ